MTIRERVRRWLGCEDSTKLAVIVGYQAQQVEALTLLGAALQTEMTEFKRALKLKAARAKMTVALPDYDTIQLQALDEFKEGDR